MIFTINTSKISIYTCPLASQIKLASSYSFGFVQYGQSHFLQQMYLSSQQLYIFHSSLTPQSSCISTTGLPQNLSYFLFQILLLLLRIKCLKVLSFFLLATKKTKVFVQATKQLILGYAMQLHSVILREYDRSWFGEKLVFLQRTNMHGHT